MLEAADAAIVNYHYRLPMTQAFGTGTLSSSDGQRFRGRTCNGTVSYVKAVRRGQDGC